MKTEAEIRAMLAALRVDTWGDEAPWAAQALEWVLGEDESLESNWGQYRDGD